MPKVVLHPVKGGCVEEGASLPAAPTQDLASVPGSWWQDEKCWYLASQMNAPQLQIWGTDTPSAWLSQSRVKFLSC